MTTRSQAPVKVSEWQKSMADYILLRPNATMKEIAAHFEVSVTWVSIVKNSDGFKEYLKGERQEHRERITDHIIDKVQGLAELCVEEMTEKVAGGGVPVEHVKDIGQMALNALGFGQSRAEAVGGYRNNVTNNIVVVDKDSLAQAREKMRARNIGSSRNASEGEIVDITPIEDMREGKEHESAQRSDSGGKVSFPGREAS